MFGAVRRKIASGSSSASVLGQSLQAIRSGAASSAPRVSSDTGKEILFYPGGISHVRDFSRLVLPGCSAGLSQSRDVSSSTQPEATMQNWSRHSSLSGSLAEAVGPSMGACTIPGALGNCLKDTGYRARADVPIAQKETDKQVTVEVHRPPAGGIQELKSWAKVSLAPGSQALARNFLRSGQKQYLNQQGHLAGYGYSTSAGTKESNESSATSEGQRFLRPLSPHLPVYQPQINSTLSIFHRFSGIYLTTVVLGSYFLYENMASICLSYPSFYQVLFYSKHLFLISTELLVLALAFHVVHGYRHLWMDFTGRVPAGKK